MWRRTRKSSAAGMLFAMLLLVASAVPASVAGEADKEMLEAGRQVFTSEAEPSCTVCHTLADADATGQVGPDLDRLQPELEQVREAVRGGLGVMPAYGGRLSDEQIEAVAQYVSEVAGAGS